ncbi:hypothetical protein BT96DRAFT_935007 [Gymnopus androsaceus JB14]|uniref:Uncharacterized protein n=1 Tax=Gymnopus androsaceus JB14 TaxID=1447944 RepID=A0A6A4I7A9_9AGAR|nr:hypothetical protein BT96DRAFT_935007 [Gymnopus androsaceus JB14]
MLKAGCVPDAFLLCKSFLHENHLANVIKSWITWNVARKLLNPQRGLARRNRAEYLPPPGFDSQQMQMVVLLRPSKPMLYYQAIHICIVTMTQNPNRPRSTSMKTHQSQARLHFKLTAVSQDEATTSLPGAQLVGIDSIQIQAKMRLDFEAPNSQLLYILIVCNCQTSKQPVRVFATYGVWILETNSFDVPTCHAQPLVLKPWLLKTSLCPSLHQ